MKNKFVTPLIIILGLGVFLFFVLSPKKEDKPKEDNTPVTEDASSGIILFYSETCSHCKLVEQYIADNGIEKKVSFVKKEAFSNQKNANELAEKAKKCGIASDSVGVPFLWDGTTCLVGDKDIIDFFKQKAGL